MKGNQKLYSLLVIIFSTATIFAAGLYFLHSVDLDIVMLFFGLTQIFGGLSQINWAQQADSKGIKKGSKSIGMFSIILGSIITVAVITKIIVYCCILK